MWSSRTFGLFAYQSIGLPGSAWLVQQKGKKKKGGEMVRAKDPDLKCSKGTESFTLTLPPPPPSTHSHAWNPCGNNKCSFLGNSQNSKFCICAPVAMPCHGRLSRQQGQKLPTMHRHPISHPKCQQRCQNICCAQRLCVNHQPVLAINQCFCSHYLRSGACFPRWC